MSSTGFPTDALREALEEVLDKNIHERGEIGAAVSVWSRGQEMISMACGHDSREKSRAWNRDTLVPVWSATKGPAALACLLAMDEAGVSLMSPVCDVWPKFAQSGKENVTFKQMLSHSAGLFALEREVSIFDHRAVIEAIEAQQSLALDGVVHAYHARTFGFLLEETVRRMTGADSLGAYFRSRIGEPMDLDFWIGLPAEQFVKVATLYPARLRAGFTPDKFHQAIARRGSPAQMAFGSPAGLNAVQEMNKPTTWAMGLPAMGGVGSASALAKFYAMLANQGMWQGSSLVPEWCLDAFSLTLSQGEDAVLCAETAFSAGMMRDPVDEAGVKKSFVFSRSAKAYGHPGAGGSLAFADPERGIGFAYVMNQMESGALPGPKTLDLVAALDEVLDARGL